MIWQLLAIIFAIVIVWDNIVIMKLRGDISNLRHKLAKKEIEQPDLEEGIKQIDRDFTKMK